MRYVIDACNLIFRDRMLEETLERHGFLATRNMLAGMLARFARAERLEEIIAVFDGSEKGEHRPRIQREALSKVTFVYADPREEADKLIVEMVQSARQPGQITVVSSDKALVRQVQRARGHNLSCRTFLRHMREALKRAADPLGGEDPRKFSGPLTQREMDEWTKWFRGEGKKQGIGP
jgi:predicted RNA-binding protein with PIN domain